MINLPFVSLLGSRDPLPGPKNARYDRRLYLAALRVCYHASWFMIYIGRHECFPLTWSLQTASP